MCVHKFIRPCWWSSDFSFKPCSLVICILVYTSPGLYEEVVALEASLPFSMWTQLCILQECEFYCGGIALVLSEFSHRGVAICQSLSKVAFVSAQCDQ